MLMEIIKFQGGREKGRRRVIMFAQHLSSQWNMINIKFFLKFVLHSLNPLITYVIKKRQIFFSIIIPSRDAHDALGCTTHGFKWIKSSCFNLG